VGPAGDVPERLEAALARDEGDVLGLRALEQATQPAAERLRPAIHRALAERVDALALLEDEDPLGPELNVHDGSTPSVHVTAPGGVGGLPGRRRSVPIIRHDARAVAATAFVAAGRSGEGEAEHRSERT
jgi:hypothetical protein